jgi:phosphatidylserine decarboxylase
MSQVAENRQNASIPSQYALSDPDVIQVLVEKAQKHPGFREELVKSLKQAKDIAQNGGKGMKPLDPKLFKAIEWWPTDWDEYLEYLRWFYRWTPHQSLHEGWKRPGTSEYQEAYDRLCHFYWLINQQVGKGDVIVQSIPWFSDWLVAYANAWGEYLDTPESFDDGILQGFIDDPWYSVRDYMIDDPQTGKWRPNAPSGWLTFNQFFARELNPGLRPIAMPTSNAYVTSPADCTYMQDYPIGADGSIPEIKVKGTHKYANVADLLQGSGYANAFGNGHFVHCFLAPYSYHRFHTPVAGVIRECYPVQGKVYLDVILGGEGGIEGQFNAPDTAQGGPGYEFSQARGVITIDTVGSPYGDIGVVAVIPIGMCQVSGVNMTHPAQLQKNQPGSPLYNAGGFACEKGEEFGYFTFGGSDIIVLFQERAQVELLRETNYHHFGTTFARCKPWVRFGD